MSAAAVEAAVTGVVSRQPAAPAPVVSAAWDVRVLHRHPDLVVSARRLRDDVLHGADSVLLKLDDAASWGDDGDSDYGRSGAGVNGLMVYTLGDLRGLFADLPLESLRVALEGGGAFIPQAALLAALQREGNVSAVSEVWFGADPLGALVRRGELPQSIARSLALLGELAFWTHERRPRSRSVTVCTSAYHEGGASPGLDIAIAVETGAVYLKAMTDRGLSPTAAAAQMSFSFSVGVDVMLAAAKLRAFRTLWEKRSVELGVEPGRKAFVHVRTSRRVLTTRDAYMNMVRDSACCTAAALAGADAFSGEPLDSPVGIPSTFAHRTTRSMQHVLRTECNLAPLGHGPATVPESLLREVSESAAEEMRHIAEAGGVVGAIKNGVLLSRVSAAQGRRAREMAVGVKAVAGVSAFAEVDGPKAVPSVVDLETLRAESAARLSDWRAAHPVAVSALQRLREEARRFEQGVSEKGQLMECAVRAAVAGATVGQLSAAMLVSPEVETASVVVMHPYAEAFERLRDAADALATRTGARPVAVVVRAEGKAAEASRAAFAQGLLEAGGFEVIWTRAGADADEVARTIRQRSAGVVVFCSEDPALQTSMDAHIAESGCAVVRCTRAAAPYGTGAGLRIHPGCDAVAVLLVLLRMCGASL